MQTQAAPAVLVRVKSRGIRAAAVGLVVGALALSLPHGVAQQVSPPGPSLSVTPNPDPPAPPSPQTPPERDNPGLIQEIGRLFERGAASVRGQIDAINQNATTTSKNIGDAAVDVGKTATDVVVKPLTARIVSGRERCGIAPNGAPDCVTAAQELCKRHGYTTGQSVDFTSAEQCSPTVFLAGRDNAPACTTVTFISRAMCQ